MSIETKTLINWVIMAELMCLFIIIHFIIEDGIGNLLFSTGCIVPVYLLE